MPGGTGPAQELLSVLEKRQSLVFFAPINSHTQVPGALTEGNAHADKAAGTLIQSVGIPILQQTKLSHEFFHQGARALAKQF